MTLLLIAGMATQIFAGNVYSIEVMEILLAACADTNKAGKTDPAATFRTLISTEKAKGKKANETLIKAWGNAMKTMKPGEVFATALVIQQTNCVPCLKLLKENGADLNKIQENGTNYLHTLASFGQKADQRKTAFASSKSAMESFGFKVPE